MRFKKVCGFEIMRVEKTQNTLELEADIIEESVIHHVFDNAPIVYNENQNFKDYRNKEDVENFINEKVVGVILPGTVDFNGLYVTADVMLLEDYSNRTHFDNWCIEYDKDKDYWFKFDSCELFSKTE